MPTCKNCIHSSVCTPYNTPNDEYPNIGDCPHFKNKADFVEVCRCENCKHFSINNGGYCIGNNGLKMASKTDYCSYGERKESEVQGE